MVESVKLTKRTARLLVRYVKGFFSLRPGRLTQIREQADGTAAQMPRLWAGIVIAGPAIVIAAK